MEPEPRNERSSSRRVRLVGLPLWFRLLIVAEVVPLSVEI